ncbi:MAG TPA: YncE family protein [Acidobacteriaceae bacterium]
MRTRFSALVSVIAFFAAVLIPVSAAFAADGSYAIVDHWKIGGEGGWDYLLADPSMHVLYLTHGTQVEVVDTNTGKKITAITGFKGTHGIALDTDGKVGFISGGAGNEVVAFDRKTYARITSIPTGQNPDGILFEPVTKTVWAFNGRSSDATVIDAGSMKVVATIKLSGKPEFPVTDGAGHIFVNIENKNSVTSLDAKKLAVAAEWPLSGCESPSGHAIDTAHHRAFEVCDGGVMTVTDYTTGKQLGKAKIGDGPDAAGYDPKNELAFSSNGQTGNLSIVSTKAGDNYKTIQTLATQKGARTMAFDSGTGRVYIVAAEYGPAPAASAQNPRPRPAAVPGSFSVLVVGRK